MLVVVLLEYINLLQLYKQSTAIVWVGLSPASLTHGFTTLLNDADVIIITIDCTEILYNKHLNI